MRRIAYTSLKEWKLLSFHVGDDWRQFAVTLCVVKLLPETIQMFWIPQQVVENGLQRGADGISTGSNV